MIINEGRPGKKLPALTNPGVAGDLLTGKQLIGADGQIITGTMASVVQATPSISVSTSGLITASATQSAGRVAAGTKSATKQLTTQAGKTVTPGRTQQTAVASGRYTTGTVYVAGDPDLKAANIKKGINIFGVAGTLTSIPDNLKIYKVSTSMDQEIVLDNFDLSYIKTFIILQDINSRNLDAQYVLRSNTDDNWALYVNSDPPRYYLTYSYVYISRFSTPQLLNTGLGVKAYNSNTKKLTIAFNPDNGTDYYFDGDYTIMIGDDELYSLL